MQKEKEFEKKIREHELLLQKICRIYAYTDADREDLLQDMLIQLWKAYPNYKGQAKFSTWLYRVAINTAITGFRKKKSFAASYEPAAIPIYVADDTSAYQRQEQQFQQLYCAIEQLNEVEKAIVMLYMEDRSYEEMEEILGINQGNLRVKMNRIKEKLRQLTKNN